MVFFLYTMNDTDAIVSNVEAAKSFSISQRISVGANLEPL